MASFADAATIRTILEDLDNWAVVGCSPNPGRDSHGVARFLQDIGKRIVPVHPMGGEILGEKVYPDLHSVPLDTRIDVVDIFRRADEAGHHVDEAIAIGAKAVWLQLGVVDTAAAQRAQDAGLLVVMDRCPKIEFPRVRARGRTA